MSPPTHIAQKLLEKSHPAEEAAAIFKEKVLHKPLHLHPTLPDATSQDARAQRRLKRLRKESRVERRRKVKPLSAKEKRSSGVHDIPDDAKKYSLYVPLHTMWLGYMAEILGMEEGKSVFVTAQSKGSILAGADYHGAELTVVRSRSAGLVGLAGIVVRDTKFTFQMITVKNECKSKLGAQTELLPSLTSRSCTQKIYRLPLRNSPTIKGLREVGARRSK